MDKCKVLLDVDSVEFKDRKKLNRMKILLQQPTFDCDPYKEGDLKEVTPGEGEEKLFCLCAVFEWFLNYKGYLPPLTW